MRGDEGDEVRACEARNGFSCADEAVGAVRSLEDFVDDDEHGQAFFLECHHALDAQDFGIEGGKAVRRVVRHADRGEDVKRREAKAFAWHGGARVGEDAGAGDGPEVRRLARHVRSRDDARACRRVDVVRHSLFLGNQEMGQVLGFEARRSVFEEFGERVHFAHESHGREGEEHFGLRPDGEPVAEVRGGLFLPVCDAVREVQVAEEEGVGEQQEDEVVTRVRMIGEGGEAAQGARGAARLELRLQCDKVRALECRIFEARKETLVEAQFAVHGGERLLRGCRAPAEREGDEELQQHEHGGHRPADEGERCADDGEREGGGKNPRDEGRARVGLLCISLQRCEERLCIVPVGQKSGRRREVEDEPGAGDQFLDGFLPLPRKREIGREGGERVGEAVAPRLRACGAKVLVDGISAEEAQILRLRQFVLQIFRARHRKVVPLSRKSCEEV